jgi:organic hydroperoxide reductase OsmC/OhrA
MAETDEIHRFQVTAAWSGDALGSGEVELPEGAPIPSAGATSLGGSGGKANPEELLLTALSACFLNTWAIFLKKLGLGYGEPTLRASGELGKDPAGGYRMEKILLHVRVPAALLAGRRADVVKTLALAEKYCILSKVVRASMRLEVAIEEV